MLVIGTLPVSHLKTATMGNLDLGILGHVRSRNIDGRMNRMTWPPGLFQVVQQDGDVLLVFLAGVEIRRCCHSICHGVFQIIKIIDPEGATLVPRRILPKHSRPSPSHLKAQSCFSKYTTISSVFLRLRWFTALDQCWPHEIAQVAPCNWRTRLW